jgi:hypothetical protein
MYLLPLPLSLCPSLSASLPLCLSAPASRGSGYF